MAFTNVGFDGTVSEAQWALFQRHRDEVNWYHGVTSGFVTSLTSGRGVSVSAGVAVLPGLLVTSNAAETETHAANATSVNRVDVVVLRADWAANTVTTEIVQGTGPTTPALTQTSGTMWNMPLARVTVRPGVTTLLASDLVVCKPIPRVMQSLTFDAMVSVDQAWNAPAYSVATVTFPDPGWPYRLTISGAVRFDGGAAYNGYGVLQAVLSGGATGTANLAASDALQNVGSHNCVMSARTTGVLNGPVTVTAQIVPLSMTNASAGLDMQTGSADHLTVNQHPA